MFYITKKFGRTKVVVEAFSLEFFLSERTSVVLMYTHECVSIKQMPHRVNIIKKTNYYASVPPFFSYAEHRCSYNFKGRLAALFANEALVHFRFSTPQSF
jgi:hypothetical protein